MAILGLGLFAVYMAVAFGLRTWLQYRRTGNSGFRGISGRTGSLEWWGGILFVVAMGAGLAGPIAGIAGLRPVAALAAPWIQTTGIALTVAGILATFAAQISMGPSWRIGVDADEMTDLVTDGAFAIARNPIFTAMGATAAGLAMVVPNVFSLLGLATLLVALQIQVRAVEEPYLRRTHGSRWDVYAARTGRFVPLLGTTRTPTEQDAS